MSERKLCGGTKPRPADQYAKADKGVPGCGWEVRIINGAVVCPRCDMIPNG